MQRIRDAAKWLIGAAAAVGAVLIAGSQLSSIGKLEFGSRLIAAVVGVVIALMAVVYAVWVAVQVLLPIAVTLGELEKMWDEKNKRADVQFFHENPRQLGYASPAALKEARENTWRARENARRALEATGARKRAEKKQDFDAADANFKRVENDIRTVLHTAQYQLLQARFGDVLKKLLFAAAAAAGGIMVYAWAANPPEPPAVATSMKGADLNGADLRDAELVGADLRDADLRRADLTGADLGDARVGGVIWSDTTCPDGTNSDDNGETCEGHLQP
jgi:hypothetical protein